MILSSNGRRSVIAVTILALSAATAWAAIEAYIHELRERPSVYSGKVVTIEGKVADVQPGETRISESSYTLQDDFGDTILVTTEDPPSIDSTVRVRGFVALNASGRPFLYERERTGASGATPGGGSAFPITQEYVVGAGVIFGILLLVVLVVARRPRAPRAPAGLPAAGHTPNAAASPMAGQSPIRPNAARTGQPAPTTRVEEPTRQATVAYLDGIRATLTVSEGASNVGGVYPILTKEVTIGRTGDICLPEDHLTISNEHAKIEYEGDGKFKLTHVSHTNTTKVNGEALTDARVLEAGDTVHLGATVLKFDSELVQPQA